jgi:SAM-dependent methyltransferase
MVQFRAAVVVAAFLLFLVQPMAARRLLPWFGGAPAVWTACLLFFQAMLLAGYGYAHWVASGGRRRLWVHRLLLAGSLAFLPLGPERPGTLEPPTAQIVWLLTRTIGLPYLLLAATSPLVQRSTPDGAPYRLYAWSNAASLAALLAYPFLVEPLLRVATQMRLWSALYVVFAGISWVAVRPAGQGSSGARPPWRATLGWMLLAAAPAGLLLATTNQMCREIAATPFLWVLPLGLYLVSWIVTFERDRWYHRAAWAVLAGLAVPAAAAVLVLGLVVPLWSHVLADSAALLACAVLCHGELARSRPEPEQLTGFYLAVAAGGVLGGLWVGVAAPRLFLSYTEFPVTLVVCALLTLGAWVRARYRPPVAGLAALLTAFLSSVAILAQQRTAGILEARRNFYGILRVTETEDRHGPRRVLTHGRVMHGFQFVDHQKSSWPTTYYGRNTAVGQLLDRHPRRSGPLRIGVIGLGVGTLAAYGQLGDVIRFYEINPAVIELARSWFSYLNDSAARVEVALGDARLVLEHEPPQNFDVLVVDAFSSDAIPVHLLTAEAAQVYRRHLRPDGTLLLHISNQSLDLRPVAGGMAQHLRWDSEVMISKGEETQGVYRATWAVLTPAGPRDLGPPPLLWTDDFSSLWAVLRFRRGS